MTGAPVPTGADAVQIVEVTQESNGYVEIQKPVKPGQNIVKMGAEIKRGDFLFQKGARITRNMIASLASFGYEKIAAAKKPKVAILSTGSEIVDISEKPGTDQIRNSNSWSLAAFAREVNAKVEILKIARDDLASLENVIEHALNKCDCLIISGGVSVGDYDFTKPALRNLGAKIFFEKVALKPGKPTVFAKRGDKLIFGLPGNPVSSAVTFFVFVRMALLKMQSAENPGLRKGRAVLSHSIKGTNGRDALLPVVLSSDANGRQIVETIKFSGSSNFVTFAGANGLVFVPRDNGLEKDEVADVYHLP
jgi:molybdenum cofactor synthesis domain-containing protein